MARRGVHGTEQFRWVKGDSVYAFFPDGKILRRNGQRWNIAKMKGGVTGEAAERLLESHGFVKMTEDVYRRSQRLQRKEESVKVRASGTVENTELLASHVRMVVDYFVGGAVANKTDYILVNHGFDTAELKFEDGTSVFIKAEVTR